MNVDHIVSALLDSDPDVRDIASSAVFPVEFEPYESTDAAYPGRYERAFSLINGKREYLGVVRTSPKGVVRVTALPHIVSVGTSEGDKLGNEAFTNTKSAARAMLRFLQWYKTRYPRHRHEP